MYKRIIVTAGMVLLMLGAVGANGTVREQEMAQCFPGEIATWQDGRDRPTVSSPMVIWYDHGQAPAWLSQTKVRTAILNAATAWSSCGVQISLLPFSPSTVKPDGSVLFQWSDEGSLRNFGLANLTIRSLNLGPSAFQLLRDRRPALDPTETLQMVISHEMGHLLGVVAHSKRCVDVTSYYNNGQGERCLTRDGSPMQPGVEYRASLPTACDIARCKAANGP
jgi:hypothetical protein